VWFVCVCVCVYVCVYVCVCGNRSFTALTNCKFQILNKTIAYTRTDLLNTICSLKPQSVTRIIQIECCLIQNEKERMWKEKVMKYHPGFYLGGECEN
jgi:hypothetical protein